MRISSVQYWWGISGKFGREIDKSYKKRAWILTGYSYTLSIPKLVVDCTSEVEASWMSQEKNESKIQIEKIWQSSAVLTKLSFISSYTIPSQLEY